MINIQATPYTPGRAAGRVTRNPAKLIDRIAVLDREALNSFSGQPRALIVVAGAPFCHPMIRLMSMGIPIVLITHAQAELLHDNQYIAVDGETGMIDEWQPDVPVTQIPPDVPLAGAPALTQDGRTVALRASLANEEAALKAVKSGATAVGLVRSECLIPKHQQVPDTSFYIDALRRLCNAAHPLAVSVRLLDLAADKIPGWLSPTPGMKGALGLQGSRLYQYQPVRSAFKAEVRAIGALASDFNLSLIVPYIVRPEEFLHWRGEIEALLPAPMAIACMLETPAAALAITDFLEIADFVALGCNDLMQCLFAADRDIAEVAAWLDPYAPVLFRLLRQLAQDAGDHITSVQVCGVLAQLPGILPILIGLGFRAFSVEPSLIPYLARTVGMTDTAAAAKLAAKVCAASDSDNVRAIVGLPSKLR